MTHHKLEAATSVSLPVFIIPHAIGTSINLPCREHNKRFIERFMEEKSIEDGQIGFDTESMNQMKCLCSNRNFIEANL